MVRGATAVLLVLAVAALAGCSSTPKQPLSVVPLAEGAPAATIRSTSSWSFSSYVTAVDGKRVKYKKSFLNSGTSQPIRVPAGLHEVDVTINGGNILFHYTFEYDFLAGHVYRMDHAGAFDQRVRVRDETAGTSVVVKGPTRL